MKERFVAPTRGIAAVICGGAGMTTLIAQSSSAGTVAATSNHANVVTITSLHALGIAGGLGLLVLARALWRGKRRAADIGVVVLLLLAACRMALGAPPIGTAVQLGLAFALIAGRDAFSLGSSRRPRHVVVSGAIALSAAAALYGAYTVALLALHHRPDVDRALEAAAKMLLAGSGWERAAPVLSIVSDILVAMLVVAGAAALRGLLRPAQGSEGHLAGEHLRALEILRAEGRDSLDPFTLREDKSLHFAAGGFLAYRVLRDTAVVSGDPIGPPGSAKPILCSFLTSAEQHGWDVVITAASSRHVAAFQELGLRTLCIGEEAVVDPRNFSLDGRAIRKVRQSVNRVERLGWGVEVLAQDELTPAVTAELSAVEEAWRARQARLSGFAMTLGRLAGADADQPGLYVLGRDADGTLRSFLRFAAYRDGLSLDLMRRSREEPNGLTEAEIVAALEHAKGEGLSRVSLNFAGFAHVMAADAALSRSQRLLRLALRMAHGRFQLERLLQFNSKFNPDWQSRHLVYQRRSQLPLASLRVLQAEAYLPAPSAGGEAATRTPRRILAWTGAAVVLCAGLMVSGRAHSGATIPHITAHGNATSLLKHTGVLPSSDDSR